MLEVNALVIRRPSVLKEAKRLDNFSSLPNFPLVARHELLVEPQDYGPFATAFDERPFLCKNALCTFLTAEERWVMCCKRLAVQRHLQSGG